MARKDIHSVSKIRPLDYEYVFSYNMATSMEGWPVPSFRVNCAIDYRTKDANGEHSESGECCIIGLRSIAKAKFAEHGGTGKCSVCGAAFVYGDVWKHIPTGEYIHLGHTCADKYNMVADRSEWLAEHDKLRQMTAAQILAHEKQERRLEFLAAHPGLEDDLKTNHYIIQDIAAKLSQIGELSEKQVQLVRRLAAESKDPEPMAEAPLGRVTFRGEVLSVKRKNSDYGGLGMTVKVSTPEGSWVAWGTVPRGTLDESDQYGGLKGCEVEVTATLQQSDKKHFVFMKRPIVKIIGKNLEVK